MPAVKRPKRVRRRTFLREWRQYRRMTLEQVAARISYHYTNLVRIEAGTVQYTQDLLEQLAEVYLCSPADLLSHSPQLAAAPPDRQRQAAAPLELKH